MSAEVVEDKWLTSPFSWSTLKWLLIGGRLVMAGVSLQHLSLAELSRTTRLRSRVACCCADWNSPSSVYAVSVYLLLSEAAACLFLGLGRPASTPSVL